MLKTEELDGVPEGRTAPATETATETAAGAARATSDSAHVNLAGLRDRCVAAATGVGALVLDGVNLPVESTSPAVVTLTSEAQVETLLLAGAQVLYVDAATLTSELADRMNTPDLDPDLDPDDAAELARAGRALRAHLGQVAGLTLGVPFAGVLHTLTVMSSWLDDFHATVATVGQRQSAALGAALDREDREDERRAAKVKTWFADVVDRLVADDSWLSLTQEAPRKQHVQRLAETELGAALDGPFPYGQRAVSLINQAVQLACQRRPEVLAQRASALAARLPELAPALVDTAGYVGATKETRTRLARQHLQEVDPVLKPGALVVSELVRVADELIASRGPGPTVVSEPGLF